MSPCIHVWITGKAQVLSRDLHRTDFVRFEGQFKKFCKDHNEIGMVNVVSPICIIQGCSKTPCIKCIGPTSKMFCKDHAKPGMANYVRKICQVQDCSKTAEFSHQNHDTPKFCILHKGKSMRDCARTRCHEPICGRQLLVMIASYDC